MADTKEDSTKVSKEDNCEVKEQEVSSNSDSEEKSPPVPPKSFEEQQHQAAEPGSETDEQKDGSSEPAKSLDEVEGPGDSSATSGETTQIKDSKTEEKKDDGKVDEEKVEKEPATESAPTQSKVDDEEKASKTEEVQSTTEEAKPKTPEVVMRQKRPSLTNGPAEKDPRASMDECIQEVRRTGRGSLQLAENPFEGINFTTQKTPQLETVLEKLSYVEGRVGHDEHKYIVPRDGITSFVFLAKK